MNGHRRIGLLAASAALAITTIGAGSAFAATPYTESGTFHRDDPQLDCGGFVAWGEWDISFSTTYYFDGNGAVVRDLEQISFNGSWYNPDTLVSVADRGTKRFKDTFAPDGSYASTDMTYQRTDAYVHEAGRTILGAQDANGDQAELRSVGHFGFNDTTIAALCAALAE
jgi:hypothetical protein